MFNDCLVLFPSFSNSCFYFIFWTGFLSAFPLTETRVLFILFPSFIFLLWMCGVSRGLQLEQREEEGDGQMPKFTKELAFWAGNVQHAPVKVSHFACDMRHHSLRFPGWHILPYSQKRVIPNYSSFLREILSTYIYTHSPEIPPPPTNDSPPFDLT